MLKKCLKYDLKAIFRVWWIAAVTVLGLSVVCGLAVRSMILLSEKSNDVPALQILVVVASVFAVVAFVILSTILYIVRFYSNFFKDEGYLTFTLPVKRQTLFASKVLTAMIVQLATMAVIVLGVCIVLLMAPYTPGGGYAFGVYSTEVAAGASNMLVAVMREIGEFCAEGIKTVGGFFWVFALEVVVFALLNELFGILQIFFCITMGATVAKKQKVLAAVGIYYAIGMALSFVQEIGMELLTSWISAGVAGFDDPSVWNAGDWQAVLQSMPVYALLLLLVVLYYAILSTVLSFASVGTLERKLNLQ